ncbi:MFS transporter [Terricaulis sp.]|uniref:MFS transporter n=1 Tax=Terricaulis sp. TaxID=2768686 RepID=UPI003782ED03
MTISNIADAKKDARIDRAAWSWALYEWARNPYVILCTIYVMAPYMTTVVIGDPVEGQRLLSSWHRNAGLVVMATAPFLGAAADRMGRRKPLLAAITLALVAFIGLQWFALPDEAGLPLWAIGAVVTAAGFCFAWTEVLHNSMLSHAAPPKLLPHVSGLGLALGNAASVLLLVFVLWAFALPGQMHWPFLPAQPLFGLDPAQFEPSRIVGPLCAIWLALFAIPIFLYTPDLNTTGERFGDAVRHGVGNVVRTVRKLKHFRHVATFLIARMFYFDGKVAILIFGGVYAAGVMQWGMIEMLAFGIILSIFAVFGGFLAGWLDHRVGAKWSVVITIVGTFVCLMIMVSMSPDAMFFVVPVAPGVQVWDGPVFQTAPEIAYICASMLIAITITAAFSSSRTLATQLAPEGMQGEIFGLYALAGSATSWLGPLLVEVFTGAYHSQKAGFASISILLAIGAALLLTVKSPPKPV